MTYASIRGRRPALLLALIAAFAATVAGLSARSTPAPADVNLSNLDCRGHLAKGVPDADDPAATHVRYQFACSGPITGYQLQPSLEVTAFETEIFGLNRTTKAVEPKDFFSCNGDLPGYGVNCIGTYGFLDNNTRAFDTSKVSYNVISGQFSIDTPLCTEPRVDVLLTVMTATVSSGRAQQAISGPFELGRPRGCKASRFSGRTRIPADRDTPAE